MTAKGDCGILNGGSTASFIPVPWSAVYGATKAFVLSFSEALAYEYRDRGVQVTILCPGNTQSNFSKVANAKAIKGENESDSPEWVAKIGLDALLTPQTSVLVLIDHQPFQFANLHSHEPTMIVNNVVGLAKAAKGFDVPTILTTVTEERGGYLVKAIQDVFPEQKPINRTTLNAWEDKRVVDAVKKTGRRQLIFAALGRRSVWHIR